LEPFNPLAVAIALDASFVARANAGDDRQTADILKKAISHRGYSLVDIFQPCVTFNHVNTYRWFKENSYYLDESYNPYDRVGAFQKAIETEKRPLGVIYISPNKKTFEENTGLYIENRQPLYQREVNMEKLGALINSMH
jgi:2-oxoglutarate ferredoxin oxidoreductase subunit beta